MTTTSILIRTKNEQAMLGETLKGVFAQVMAPTQVIVIDSGSTDRTLEIAAQYPVRILELPPAHWGYSRALNLAASHATGEILVCLSAHCPPVHDLWLANLCRHFADPSVAAVWGPGLRPGRQVPAVEAPLRQEPGTYSVETRTWGLSNPNSALRRSLWRQFPFDENMPAAEDKAWGKEAMDRGYAIVYEPDAAVWHAPHPPLAAFRRNRAVMAGFKVMFPELEVPAAGSLAQIGRGLRNTLRRQREDPSAASLWRDMRHLPAILTGLVGSYVGGHRRKYESAGPPTAASEVPCPVRAVEVTSDRPPTCSCPGTTHAPGCFLYEGTAS